MRIPEGKHITAFDTYIMYSDVRHFESDKKHALTFSTLHISEIDRSFTTYAGFIFMLSKKYISECVSILKIYIFIYSYILSNTMNVIIFFFNTVTF